MHTEFLLQRDANSWATVPRAAKYAIAATAVGWLAVSLGGGSSRADIIQLIPMRVVVCAMLGVVVWVLPRGAYRDIRAPLWFLVIAAAVVAAQLLPLPFTIWSRLPGRELYVQALAAAGAGQPWHALSLSPDLTWNSLLALLPPALFICGLPVANASVRELLFLSLLATIVISGFLGLLQVAAGSETALRFYKITNVDSGVGLFANRNHQAVFLAMGIPLSAWLGKRIKDRGRRTIGLAIGASSIAFLLSSILVTQSRTGAAIAAMSLLASAILFMGRQRPSRGMVFGLSGAGVVMLAIGVVAIRAWSPARLGIGALGGDLRLMIFADSVTAVATFFPFGAGFGTFPEIFPRFESFQNLQPEYFNHTHMEPTNLLVEGGLASVMLVALFLSWFAWASYRVWARPASRSAAADARLCSIVLALPVLASLTDYPLRSPLMLCTAAAIGSMLHRLASPVMPGSAAKQSLDGNRNRS